MQPKPTIFYVYIVQCSSANFYVGQTRNLRQRLHFHRLRLQPTSTLNVAGGYKRLVAVYKYHSRQEAIMEEREIAVALASCPGKKAFVDPQWMAEIYRHDDSPSLLAPVDSTRYLLALTPNQRSIYWVVLGIIMGAQSKPGGWTSAQLAEWNIAWPPRKGWKTRLIREWVAMA